ncbi:MAG: hypothetical protein ACI4OH_00530, partial [Mitsuokella sp.]|uniref:hypothetical protein n=1 Tax=Mitsuokella sp. TaxID=2049034 RepID=UPI003F0E6108
MKHSHRRRRSAFKAKVGLTAAVLLTLSGPMAAQAAEKPYGPLKYFIKIIKLRNLLKYVKLYDIR